MLRMYLFCMFFLSFFGLLELSVHAQEDPAAAENPASIFEQALPMNLEAVALSGSEIQLTWNAQNRGQDGYIVERSDDGQSFTQIATLPGDATSFTDISLPPSSTRYYRVRPYHPSSMPEAEEQADATTLAIIAAVPVAPSNLNVKVSASPALLAWFYRPPQNTDTYTVAKNYDSLILTERDEPIREDLRSKGAPPPFLVYLMSNQIHDPGSCTKQPFKNQVADRIGDFCNISANHPDWFLKDKNGVRISKLDGIQLYYFMDPGNAEWRNFFITRARESIESLGWNGIFLDNLDGTLNRFKRLNKLPGKYQTDTAYRAALESYLNHLSDSYFGPNNIPLYGNITEVGDGSAWFQYISHMTGAMNENFALKWNDQYHDLSVWQEHVSRASQTASMGKKQILVCQGGQFNTARQNFCYGSYLLIAAPGIYLRYSTTSTYNRIALYANWNLDLGEPTGNRFFSNGLWRRNFTKGSVSVDPVAHTAQIIRNSGNQLDLSWKDNSSDESGFKIERSLDGVLFTQIATTSANTTRYSNKSLSTSKLYYYRVRAFNGSGNSAYSAVRNAKTNPAVPTAAGNLQTTSISSTQIKISWSDNSGNETGFHVERSFNGTQFGIIATRPAGATNYTDTLLTPSTRYYYRIASFNAGGPAAYTASVSPTTSAPSLPIAPTNLVATAASGPRINLTWNDTANNDEGFKIERSLNGTSFSSIATAPVNATSYSDTSVSGSTKYYYRVRAFNTFGSSSSSNTASATTP